MNERQDPTNGTLPCFNSDVRLLSVYLIFGAGDRIQTCTAMSEEPKGDVTLVIQQSTVRVRN